MSYPQKIGINVYNGSAVVGSKIKWFSDRKNCFRVGKVQQIHHNYSGVAMIVRPEKTEKDYWRPSPVRLSSFDRIVLL